LLGAATELCALGPLLLSGGASPIPTLQPPTLLHLQVPIYHLIRQQLGLDIDGEDAADLELVEDFAAGGEVAVDGGGAGPLTGQQSALGAQAVLQAPSLRAGSRCEAISVSSRL